MQVKHTFNDGDRTLPGALSTRPHYEGTIVSANEDDAVPSNDEVSGTNRSRANGWSFIQGLESDMCRETNTEQC